MVTRHSNLENLVICWCLEIIKGSYHAKNYFVAGSNAGKLIYNVARLLITLLNVLVTKFTFY